MAFDGGDIEFRDVTRLMDVFHRAQVTHDLNNDMAGRETGRITRVAHADLKTQIDEKKARERFANLILELTLQDLLNDPDYRKRWEEFGGFLTRYSGAAQKAMTRATEIADTAKNAVQQSSENAHKLDGKAVFETDDGRFVYADGVEIAADAYDRIERNANADTYAEYLLLVEAAANAEATVAKIKGYQARLESAEERRHDPDNHYKSIDEMEAEQRRLRKNAPRQVLEHLQKVDVEVDAGNVPSGKLTLGSSK